MGRVMVKVMVRVKQMKKVYVLGHESDADWLIPLYDEIHIISYLEHPGDIVAKVDLLIFTGGQDISPSLYGEYYPEIHFSPDRDAREVAWFKWAVEHNVPMFGICRGMQLLNALTGGKLIPDVNNHYQNHSVHTHFSKEVSMFHEFQVNSIHHQMCIPPKTARLLAWARYQAFQDGIEPEALWFPTVRALGVQWHPEMMDTDSKATQFIYSQLVKYLGV